MKKLIILIALVVAGAFAWGIGSKLSADAIGMGIGVLLGVMAGVPAAILLMVANRQRGRGDEDETPANMRQLAHQPMHGYPPQAPVIVLAGNGMGMPQQQPAANGYGAYPGHPALPGPQAGAPDPEMEARRFKVVGEEEAWVDEW